MKIQILYPIYELTNVAIKRLKLSIKSILHQDVGNQIEICISDGSLYKTDLSFLNTKYKYYHNFVGTILNKSRVINQGFKNLIDEEFFFVSDIDLIYPPHYLTYMINNLNNKNKLLLYKVIRSVTSPYGEIYNLNNITEKRALEIEKDILNKWNIDKYLDSNELILHTNDKFKHKNSPSYVIESDLFYNIKGFDENYTSWGSGDTDFAFRASFFTEYKILEPYMKNMYIYHLYHKMSNNFYLKYDNNLKYFEYKLKNITNKKKAIEEMESIL